jgi:hypothetical protein
VVSDGVCAACGATRGDGSWCPLCLERYDRPAAAAPEPSHWRAPRVSRAYSRTEPGPMSFGVFGRVSLSIVPVVIAFFAVRNIIRSRHDATIGYYLVLGVPALVLALGFLAVVWKRERVS